MKTWLRFWIISKTNATPNDVIIVNLHFNRMLRKCFLARHGNMVHQIKNFDCMNAWNLFVTKGFFDFNFCIEWPIEILNVSESDHKLNVFPFSHVKASLYVNICSQHFTIDRFVTCTCTHILSEHCQIFFLHYIYNV